MTTKDLLHLASSALKTNTSQTAMTMLGIIIGVCAVVLMTGVGKSMEGVILGQIGILGPRTIGIWPGQQGPEGGSASLRPDFDALKLSDAEALSQLETVTSVAPLMFVPGSARYGREEMDPRIVGAAPGYYANQNIEVNEGVLHDNSDERARRSVAVIGSDVVEDLFPSENPIGKRIDMAGRKFTVIGVLDSVGTQFLQNLDDRIIIPLQTAVAITNRSYVDAITLQSIEGIDPGLAQADIQLLLRQRHRILSPVTDPTENDDFLVRTAAQATEILTAVSAGLTVFITMIAGISLIVGGIGIMNIMLVSVTERTREIGLRKAVGATYKDILHQFLTESVFITTIGGVVGVFIGLGLMYLVALGANRMLDRYIFAISPISIVLALAMAALTGVIFGLYPARKAAKLEPITALRYE